MARKKLLAVAIGMFMPAAAQALTLEQIKVGSLLDQPLKAAIEVTAERQEELDSLSVGLAPPRRFAEKGIPRPKMLEDLRFEVVQKEGGKAVVIVTTSTPVREPFLDFLVEATWEAGQVTREYTVLLDPPFTADRPPPAIEVPAQATAPVVAEKPAPAAEKPAPAAEKPAPASEKAKAQAEAAAQPAATPKAASAKAPRARPAGGPGGGRLEVREGDTLWSLAKSVRPTGATVYQTLNALYAANPNAFLEQNVNLMLEGAILRVPPREEILALDQRAAERLLAEHTRAWRPGTPASAGTGEAGDSQAEAEAPAPKRETVADAEQQQAGPATPDELRLASAGTAGSAARAGDAEEGPADAGSSADETAQQLVLAREETASVRQEAEELRSRLNDLEAQLKDANRLLELKDEQLARLQAYYAAQEEAEEEAALPAPPADEDAVPDDVIAAETIAPGPGAAAVDSTDTEMAAKAGEPAPDESVTDARPEAVEALDSPGAQEPAVAPAASTAEPPGEGSGRAEADLTADAAGVAETTDAAESRAPAEAASVAEAVEASTAPEAAAEPTPRAPVFDLNDIPVLPVLGGVAAAGLLGLLFLLRRRRGEGEPGPAAGAGPVTARAVPVKNKQQEPSTAMRLAEVDDLLAAGDTAGAGVVAGRLLAENPAQPQVAMKMFEVHHAAGDGAAFSAMAKKLAATGFAADYADVWTRVEEMGRELLPRDPLFAREVPKVEVGEAEVAGPDLATPGVEAEGKRDLDEMLASLESRLDDSDSTVRQEATEALGEAAAHLDSGAETASPQEPEVPGTAASAQPETGQEEETPTAFEPGAVSAEDEDAGAPAAELEHTIEFDLDSLEERSPMVDEPADVATDEATSDVGDLHDALEFTATTGQAAEEGPAATELGMAEDTSDSLDFSVPEIDLETAAGAQEAASGDVDNIVALHPEGVPAPEETAAGDEDEVQTKLDLARAFLDLGDAEGARGILEEVLAEGNERQREEAESLLSNTA